MIARIWRAKAKDARATEYARHFSDHVLPTLRRIAGFKRAALLREVDSEQPELIVISWWTSEEAIRGFAGPDISRAVVDEDAQRVLASFEQAVRHYSVIVEEL